MSNQEFQISDSEMDTLDAAWAELQKDMRENDLPAPTAFCELKWDDEKGEKEKEFASLTDALEFASALRSGGPWEATWDCMLCGADGVAVCLLYSRF